ncbi:MAG: DUF4280 domain-containing protein [Tepidibacter sp.]|jgi:hypothetical protein|uniref:DUF4280 domain-containing protein n=1 Tax=Tepidibacter sp. TaxID=2529387 RepID=UPI0025E717C6|nr:DUF4280 domain-containing protein [Tepidibacter sp.]MCT4508153.1 DUF4280 domain-containing protein [Tepidibacter sp.]
MAETHAYVVRGARMVCSCGSHKRRINLPQCHGVYIKNQPKMNQNDCKHDNIPYFGICSNPSSSGAEVINLVSPDRGEIQGFKCERNFLGVWENVKEDCVIDGVGALKTDSYIICEHGGCIAFENSGQVEEEE